MLESLHGGDFLHPNDAGYRRMGEAAADAIAPGRDEGASALIGSRA